jgi:hypothetical protein
LVLEAPRYNHGVTVQAHVKTGRTFIAENGSKKKDQVLVHEAIGRVGIKVIERQKERKKDPDAKS